MAIVVTAQSTQRTVVDARCSDAYEVRPDCLNFHTKGGADDDTVNAAVVDLDSIGFRAVRKSDHLTVNLKDRS